MKRFGVVLGLVVALAVASSGVASASDQYAEVSQDSGSYAMSASELQAAVPAADYAASLASDAAAMSGADTSRRERCYGQVYWKAGKNATGVTIWKEWNHTAWCGIPFDHVIDRTVSGHTDTYTSPVWDVSNQGWSRHADTSTQKAWYTRGTANFKECLGPVCLSSETINTNMHIFANGAWNGS